jgi:hypothetical protein
MRKIRIPGLILLPGPGGSVPASRLPGPARPHRGLLRELVARKAPGRYGAQEAERVPGAHAQIAREVEVIERLEDAAMPHESMRPALGKTLGVPPLPGMTPAEETLADLWATSTYGTHR